MTSNLRHHHLEGRKIYRLTGGDGRDLLQRISTADVARLSEDRPVAALLTNEKGRVVDLVGVTMETDGPLLVACMGDDDGRVQRWLERYIIMEDVAVTDLSGRFRSFILYAQGFDGAWSMPPNVHRPLVPITLGRNTFGLGILSAGGDTDIDAIPPAFGMSVDAATFLADRVAAGVPWMGAEIGEHRHPLEARLRDLVSFTKGCYIGQEVIARLDAYRKVQMALTRFAGSIASGEKVPITLSADDGTDAGLITSVVSGPSRVCGLGFVRISLLQGATPLRSANGTTAIPLDTDPSQQIYV